MKNIWIAEFLLLSALAEEAGACSVVLEVSAGRFNNSAMLAAEAQATAMFREIGVPLFWSHRPLRPDQISDSCGEPILIALDEAERFPRVGRTTLAFAMPYSPKGTRIHVFVDRIRQSHHQFVAILLAHVLVHEITHVLQGVCRHSPEGIMKAHWTEADYLTMRLIPMHFAADDVDMIRSGMARRNEGFQTTSLQSGLR